MATPVLGVQCVAANKFLHFYGGAILMEGAAAMHQKILSAHPLLPMRGQLELLSVGHVLWFVISSSIGCSFR
jgi:hypothetical protein